MTATPRDAADDVLTRAEALLALGEAPSAPDAVRADLRRMALALGVAALDTYLHWAIRRTDLATMPKKLAKLGVTFGDLVTMGQKSVEARKQKIDDRPTTRARNVLNDKLLTITFQTAQQVEDALAMLGVDKSWTKLSAVMSPPATPEELKTRLNNLAHRRNKIVHEGDLRRLVRPQAVAHEEIEHSTVDEDLTWIRAFIEALTKVVP